MFLLGEVLVVVFFLKFSVCEFSRPKIENRHLESDLILNLTSLTCLENPAGVWLFWPHVFTCSLSNTTMDATKINPNMFSPWRAHPPPQPKTVYDAIVSRALDGKIRSLSPRGLADILWGCAVTSRGTSKLFEELCSQAQEKIDLFSPRDIANFSWGLVQVKFQCWPLQNKFVKLCMSRLGEFDGESLVLTFWSLVQITELQDKLDRPVRAARYTLCQHVPQLSAPSCKRLWEILATLEQYDFDLCKILDQQTGEWGHLMTPSELGQVLRAGSDLRYRMSSLPELYHLAFKHMELTSKTMDPKLLGKFVLDFLSSIYCYGSWIEEQDTIERVRVQTELEELKKQQLRDQKRQNELNLTSGQGVVVARKEIQVNGTLGKKINANHKEKEDEDDEIKSILPRNGVILNDIALNVMSSIMPTVIANASIAQTMEMLMALTAARAYRTTTVVEKKEEKVEEKQQKEEKNSENQHEKKNEEEEEEEETNRAPSTPRSRMYAAAWSKLGNGKSLNDGQIIYLCACYDLMTYDGCPDDCKPPQVVSIQAKERHANGAL